MQISFTYDGVKYVITEEGLLSQCLRQKILDKGESLNEMPPDVATVQNCMAWLLEYARPRRYYINYKMRSDVLKDVVQIKSGLASNGALIEAVFRLGWDVIPEGPESPNAYFRLALNPAILDAYLGRERKKRKHKWVQCRIRRIMHYYSNNEEDD